MKSKGREHITLGRNFNRKRSCASALSNFISILSQPSQQFIYHLQWNKWQEWYVPITLLIFTWVCSIIWPLSSCNLQRKANEQSVTIVTLKEKQKQSLPNSCTQSSVRFIFLKKTKHFQINNMWKTFHWIHTSHISSQYFHLHLVHICESGHKIPAVYKQHPTEKNCITNYQTKPNKIIWLISHFDQYHRTTKKLASTRGKVN